MQIETQTTLASTSARSETAQRHGWLLALVLAGCSTCGKSTVPFKHGGVADGGTTTSGQAPSSTRVGGSYPPGTTSVQLDGQRLALSAGAIRAGVDVDLDADGDRDALLLTADEAGGPQLQYAWRQPEGWGPLAALPPLLESAEHCTLVSGSVEALDASYGVARAELLCGAASDAPGPATVVPASGSQIPTPGGPTGTARPRPRG